ncbi:protein MCM10 homolog [Episyrphus balteatus]|uniref:protein MCM10 homolog n=1 Tax=Episyrphus balteatus TaxID=286459 RepID=UPI002484E09C|nr:protein MCM10 homolog [Episyrphus balteatus]
MSPSSKPFEANDEDDDVFELEKLLAAAEADEAKISSQPNPPAAGNDLEELLAAAEADEAKTSSQPKKPATQNNVPRLREDGSFAEAFSYDIDSNIMEKATKATELNTEEMDSSDDEEVKNFLERKYNEYGRDINKKLKQQNEAKHEAAVAQAVAKAVNKPISTDVAAFPHNPQQRNSYSSTKTNIKKPIKPNSETATPANVNTITNYMKLTPSVFTDPVFGLRIINPLVSSTGLIERMSERTPIPFSTLAFHTQRGDLNKDWVIGGVLVSKSPVKTSKNGSPFSIWKLSDLKGDMKLVSLFMFRTAHKNLWKTATGMCIAVLNPSVLDKRAESGDIACLSIDTDQKVMILGQSKDLGTCKAKKKNGDPCLQTVNLGNCDYCIFHMKQEYSKMSQRSELQSSTAGRGLNELRNKILGKSEVFYAGQSFTAVPAKRSAKLAAKDSKILMGLSEYAVSPNAASVNHASAQRQTQAVPYAARGGPVSKIACNVEANKKQRLKDIERLKILQMESEKFASSNTSKEINKPAATPEPEPATKPSASVPEKFKNCEFSFSNRSPQLSRENFCIEVTVGEKKADMAKLKAMQLLKKKPLAKANPNFIKHRGTSEGKRRAIDDLNDKFGTESKRQKLDEEQREIDRKTRIQKIMEATSSHTNLVDSRELQEQEKYFNKLEKKEALEEKMLNTFKMPCKAVICIQCKYTAFSAADRCKEERHQLKVIDTEKRFYQCKDCGNRTATVHKLPKTSCKNCKGSRWERTAMIRERKIDDGREMLSIRGDEEMFMGSITSKANLNLLVPE